MASLNDVLDRLQSKAKPGQLKGMAKYGMTIEKRLGVSVPDMRRLAKELGKDHKLALNLWRTGVVEARIVAGMVGGPDKLTEEQMEEWVKDIDSWGVWEQGSRNLFSR